MRFWPWRKRWGTSPAALFEFGKEERGERALRKRIDFLIGTASFRAFLCGILIHMNENQTPRLVIVPVIERPGMFRPITPDPAAAGLSPNYGELTEAGIRTLFAGKFEASEIDAAIKSAKASQ